MKQTKALTIARPAPGLNLVHLSFAMLALAFTILMAMPAFAGSADISDRDAYALQQQGKLILVDVRTEAEWQQTGIAPGAVPITMQDPQFVAKISQLQQSEPGKQIAFICASSRRSGIVQAELARRGFSDVYSVYGGMTGNGVVPGWIGNGLPVEPWTQAN